MKKFEARLGPRKNVEKITGVEKEQRIREMLNNGQKLPLSTIASKLKLDSSSVKKALSGMLDIDFEEIPIPRDKIRSVRKTKTIYFLK